MTLTYK